ncbi:MAG: phage holin family protein [Akkermansia sp.]
MSILSKLWGFVSAPASREVDADSPIERETPTLRQTLSQVLDHIRTLATLFVVEVEEAADRAKVKLLRLILAAGLLIVGYLLLCGFAVAVLEIWVGMIGALGILAAIHLITGGIFLYIGLKSKIGPILPSTLDEINTDYTCLQIAIKENRNY